VVWVDKKTAPDQEGGEVRGEIAINSDIAGGVPTFKPLMLESQYIEITYRNLIVPRQEDQTVLLKCGE